MPAERMPEPWPSFLAEIDRSAAAPIDLHCLGGFAVSVYYGLEVDVEDVKHLARSKNLDLDLLKARYKAELRPIVVGPPERHDQTLRLWIEAINEERGAP
jgi:hypothetical protein